MTKIHVFFLDNNKIFGYTDDPKELIKEYPDSSKANEVDIHPAQLEWLEEGFTHFGQVQQYLADRYSETLDPIDTVDYADQSTEIS